MSARGPKRFVLGVDGGGTKSAVALWDTTTNRIAIARGGSGAVVGIPSESARQTLIALIDEVLAAFGATRVDIAACALGLSGIDFADEHPDQVASLSNALAMGRELSPRELVNDAIVALWGASPSEASAIVQHGTAITSAYRARFGAERCFDHLDAGRQHDLRAEALVLVARMIDGRAKRTSLCDRVLARLDVNDPGAFHETVFRRRATGTLPPLAGVVFAAWEDGDTAAAALIEATLDDYVATCTVMARRTESLTPYLAFGGGVIDGAPARWRLRLEARVGEACPGAVVGRPQLRPECGALVMAAHAMNIDPAEAFTRIAEASACATIEGKQAS